MNTTERLIVVILAGGSGTRLWPRSRQALPKQFLDLTGQGTMLHETYARPRWFGLAHAAITNQQYGPGAPEQPDLPLIHHRRAAERHGRGRAWAVMAQHLRPDAIMVFAHADHPTAGTFRCATAAEGCLRRWSRWASSRLRPHRPAT